MIQNINKIFFNFILILFFIQYPFAQDNNQQTTQDKIFYSRTGFVNDSQPVIVHPPYQKFSDEKTQILAELDKARLNYDTQKKEQLEARLNIIDNAVPVVSYPDGTVQSSGPINKEVGADFDYNYSMIANLPHWNHAVEMVPAGSLIGRVYVAVGVYANYPNSDTVKVFYSTNGGISWVLQYSWWMPGLNMDFRGNEMDITVLYNGTTAWLLGVTPINNITNNSTRTIFWRYNLTTHEFYYVTLYWPGSPATNLDYNGRLASDNAMYIGTPFLYITVSSDSLLGSGNHINRTKFAYISNPFGSPPSITYRNIGSYYTGNNPSLYVYNDVAFIYSGLNRVFVLMSLNGITQISLNYSDDFGATYSGGYDIAGSYPLRGSSLASVVADGYPRMMIVNRVFTGSNWDIDYYYTSTGGSNAGSWTHGFIENTSYKSSGYPNVTWVRGNINSFKAAFTLDSGGITRPYYAGWNSSAWNSPSRMAVGNLQADSLNACPVAGYMEFGGDNCLAVWSNFYPIYASIKCLNTVGINGNNNNIPGDYSLYQNYPNPFNPQTEIKFGLPIESFVKLVIYDVLGREVGVLVNEELKPGTYEVGWDGSKFASGVYYYKLLTNDFVDTKKMLLVK